MIPVASVVTHLCHNNRSPMTDRPRHSAIWWLILAAWFPLVLDDPVMFGAWVAIAGLLLFWSTT